MMRSNETKQGQLNIEALRAYFRRCPHPVTLAYLFGSAARGETTPLSDVDIAVYLDVPELAKRTRLYSALLADLEEALGNGSPDLILLNEAPSGVARDAVAGLLLFQADPRQRMGFERQVLCRYLDERPFHAARQRLIRRRAQDGQLGQRGMNMFEERVISERLEYIHHTLARLRRHRGKTLESLLADEDTYRAALYDLQTVLEAIADIANHLIVALALRKPRNRAEAMLILGEAGVIPPSLAERLAQAQRMRNIIVHGYLNILANLVHRVIQEDLEDIETFCSAVIEHIEGERG